MKQPARKATRRQPANPARDLRICFIGDSLTAGIGDPAGLGWVGRVAIATRKRGIALTAYNLGVRLDTSLDVSIRWKAEASARLQAGDDHRIVLAVGTNDATLVNGRPRVTPKQTISHVSNIITAAQACGWDTFVVGPPPSLDLAQTDRIIELSRGIGRACRDLATPYIPVAESLASYPAWSDEQRQGDGAHPAERGYQRMAAIVLDSGWWPWINSALTVAD